MAKNHLLDSRSLPASAQSRYAMSCRAMMHSYTSVRTPTPISDSEQHDTSDNSQDRCDAPLHILAEEKHTKSRGDQEATALFNSDDVHLGNARDRAIVAE